MSGQNYLQTPFPGQSQAKLNMMGLLWELFMGNYRDFIEVTKENRTLMGL